MFKFSDFEVDADRRALLKQGSIVNLNPKAFDLLLALVENRGKIITKNDCWRPSGKSIRRRNNLTVHLAALRKILGEKRGEYQFIVTLPGKGYKFVGLVNVTDRSERCLTENLWKFVENITWIDAENLASIGDGKIWTVSREIGEEPGGNLPV